MISHKYKCIFIHIPRTAGTSIEKWICGSNWWDVQPETKHLTASQAKKHYKEYWQDYFKFSFVRNPWDRSVSCLNFSKYFGIYYQRKSKLHFRKTLNFDEYIKKIGAQVPIEYDYRFYTRGEVASNKHLPGQIYQNLLDEKLDFIGKFENLSADCKKIQETLGLEKKFNEHLVNSNKRKTYQHYYNKNSIEVVRTLYEKDIEHFGYEY